MSSQGAIQLAEALLKPRKNADSSWTPASSLEELYLFGISTELPLVPEKHAILPKSFFR
jgi:hypothetical protein